MSLTSKYIPHGDEWWKETLPKEQERSISNAKYREKQIGPHVKQAMTQVNEELGNMFNLKANNYQESWAGIDAAVINHNWKGPLPKKPYKEKFDNGKVAIEAKETYDKDEIPFEKSFHCKEHFELTVRNKTNGISNKWEGKLFAYHFPKVRYYLSEHCHYNGPLRDSIIEYTCVCFLRIQCAAKVEFAQTKAWPSVKLNVYKRNHEFDTACNNLCSDVQIQLWKKDYGKRLKQQGKDHIGKEFMSVVVAKIDGLLSQKKAKLIQDLQSLNDHSYLSVNGNNNVNGINNAFNNNYSFAIGSGHSNVNVNNNNMNYKSTDMIRELKLQENNNKRYDQTNLNFASLPKIPLSLNTNNIPNVQHRVPNVQQRSSNYSIPSSVRIDIDGTCYTPSHPEYKKKLEELLALSNEVNYIQFQNNNGQAGNIYGWGNIQQNVTQEHGNNTRQTVNNIHAYSEPNTQMNGGNMSFNYLPPPLPLPSINGQILPPQSNVVPHTDSGMASHHSHEQVSNNNADKSIDNTTNHSYNGSLFVANNTFNDYDNQTVPFNDNIEHSDFNFDEFLNSHGGLNGPNLNLSDCGFNSIPNNMNSVDNMSISCNRQMSVSNGQMYDNNN